jgi:hypothetical protein
VGRAAVQRGSVQLRFICDSIHRARRYFADKLSSKLLRRRADDKFFLHLWTTVLWTTLKSDVTFRRVWAFYWCWEPCC